MENNSPKDVLVLRLNNTDYFFRYLTDDPVYAFYKSNMSVLEKLAFKIQFRLNTPFGCVFGDWKQALPTARHIILYDYGYHPTTTKYIKKVNPKCRTHLFAFNVLKPEAAEEIRKDPNLDYIWSFDRGDVEKYGFRQSTPMFTKNLYEPSKDARKCVVFVGAPKSREKEILGIRDVIGSIGIETDFRIVRSKEDYVDYDTYLNMIRSSNCILDITNEGQLGLTLRFMEALFLSKKLITNNRDVRRHPLYDPENIFIYGEDPVEKLRDFLMGDYHPVDDQILAYYDFAQWIKRFVEVDHA